MKLSKTTKARSKYIIFYLDEFYSILSLPDHSDIEQGLEDWKPTGENNHQDSNEQSRQTLILPPRFHRSQEPKTDENERSRKRLARSPCSDWSQTSDGEDEDERPRKRAVNSPYSNRSQISDEDGDEQEQSCKRSIFSPDPSARALSATEADFDEDVVRRIYEEVDELEEESISAPSPAPLESKGTQTSPSLSPTRIALPSPPASARRILPLNTSGQRNRIEATSPTSTSHSQELHNTNHRLVQSPSSSSRNLPLSFGRNAVPVIANNIDLTNNPPARMIRTKTGKLQKAPKVRSASVPWTEEEVRALEENVALHGSAWALILTTDTRLRAHTDAQLKDKATNEIKKRLKLSQDHPQLGGFAAIYNPKRKYI
jgi:hypothetical protein